MLPSIEMLGKMADVFCVTTDFLLGRTEEAMLDVSCLTEDQRAHIALVVRDLGELNRRS